MGRTRLTRVELFNLFPTTIAVYDLQRELNKHELETITECVNDFVLNQGNKTSKNKYVLKTPALCNLNNFFLDCVNDCMQRVFEETTKLRITQSWLNRTDKGQFHHIHTHPNSYLSGVFYVKTTVDDRITFHNTDTRSIYYQPVYENFNISNSSTWWLPATQNKLYLFRSDVWHSVPQIQHDERISLSFNTFFAEDFGSETSIARLPLL